SRDLERCARCLGLDAAAGSALQAERRELARQLLAVAAAVVYPSDFLLRIYGELFPDLPRERQHVIAPALADATLPPGPPRSAHAPGRPLHVAYVGAVQPHKGALLFLDVLARLSGNAGLRFSAYGGGD